MPATPECRAERKAGRREARKEGESWAQARASCACR